MTNYDKVRDTHPLAHNYEPDPPWRRRFYKPWVFRWGIVLAVSGLISVMLSLLGAIAPTQLPGVRNWWSTVPSWLQMGLPVVGLVGVLLVLLGRSEMADMLNGARHEVAEILAWASEHNIDTSTRAAMRDARKAYKTRAWS